MIGFILLVLIGFMTFQRIASVERELAPVSQKAGKSLQKLWQIAQVGIKERKYLRAEKALLTILKLDQRNAAAYNRLGILYSRQKEYKDAIECFEIASSIEPSAASLHNLGLIYFETENYEKAATAFEQSINLDGELAARQIAYAKVQEQLGNYDIVIDSLKKAIELEPNEQTYRLLQNVYKQLDRDDEVKEIDKKLEKLIVKPGQAKRVKRAKRVVY